MILTAESFIKWTVIKQWYEIFEIKKAGFEAGMEKKAEFEKMATWKTYRGMSE